MKKFLVLIEDDFEVMGNGLGNVADLQYLPALNLVNIANKYKIYAYDAYFIETAKELNGPLFSLDKNLLQIAKKEGLKVIEV